MYDNPPPELTLATVAVLATFATIWALIRAAHHLADHWIQTDRQACAKGKPGWRGRAACAAHVATYTATAGVFLGLGSAYLGLRLELWPTVIGLGVSAVSHYIADRREPLRRIADAFGKGRFVRVADGGINGAYLLDQSWHAAFLAWSALIIASGTERLPLTVAIGTALTAAVVLKVRRTATVVSEPAVASAARVPRPRVPDPEHVS